MRAWEYETQRLSPGGAARAIIKLCLFLICPPLYIVLTLFQDRC